MRNIFFIIGLLPLLFLSSYANQPSQMNPHHDSREQLTIQNYLTGHQQGYGLVFDREGRSLMSFKKDIRGTWRGDQGYITEIIQYANGEKIYHEWCVHLIDAHHFAAVSTASSGVLEGEQFGNTIHIRYHPWESSDLFYPLVMPQEVSQKVSITKTQFNSFIENINDWYDALRSYSALNKKQNRSQEFDYDIGPVCKKIVKNWKISDSELSKNRLIELWMYKITPKMVLSKMTLMQKKVKIGETITVFSF